jgi:preprotein translocase subunit SecG
MFGTVISYLIPVLHVAACLFLIAVVLLQTGKGADMGAVFGGGSQTLFGSTGAGNLLTKVTTGLAITFMLTSLILTYGQTARMGSTILDRLPAPGAVAPAAPPAGGQPSVPAEPQAEAPAADAPATGAAPAPDAPAEP